MHISQTIKLTLERIKFSDFYYRETDLDHHRKEGKMGLTPLSCGQLFSSLTPLSFSPLFCFCWVLHWVESQTAIPGDQCVWERGRRDEPGWVTGLVHTAYPHVHRSRISSKLICLFGQLMFVVCIMGSLPAWVSVYPVHVVTLEAGREYGPPGPKVQMVGSCHVGVGN